MHSSIEVTNHRPVAIPVTGDVTNASLTAGDSYIENAVVTDGVLTSGTLMSGTLSSGTVNGTTATGQPYPGASPIATPSPDASPGTGIFAAGGVISGARSAEEKHSR